MADLTKAILRAAVDKARLKMWHEQAISLPVPSDYLADAILAELPDGSTTEPEATLVESDQEDEPAIEE